MARIGRGVPPQAFNVAGQALGPRDPLATSPLAQSTTPGQLRVATTCVAVSNSRRPSRRFPLQGWGGQETIETGSAGTISFGASSAAAGQIFGSTPTNQKVAVSLVSPRNASVQIVRVKLRKNSAPTDNVVVEIQSDSAGNPSGVALASASINSGSLTTTSDFYDLVLSVDLPAGTQNWLVFQRDGALDAVNNYTSGKCDVLVAGSPDRTFSGTWGVLGQTPLYFAAKTIGDNLGVFARNLGPRPPLFINPVSQSPVVATLSVNLATGLLTQQRRAEQRIAKSLLFPPATLAQPPPPPVVTTLRVTFAVAVKQRILSIGQLAPAYRLGFPVVLSSQSLGQREQTIEVSLVRTRARRIFSSLPETIVVAAAATFTPEPIVVALVRARPRKVFAEVSPPQALVVFSGPHVALQRIKPSPTGKTLGEPTVVRVPSVEQRRQTIARTLATSRRPVVAAFLRRPTVLRVQVFAGPTVSLARTRPRPIRSVLPETIVAAAQFVAEPVSVALTHTRPRPTSHALGAPTVLRVPSVEQQRRTLRVSLVQARPRATAKQLRRPTVVRVPSVEQREQTVQASLARVRPRRSISSLPETIVTAAGFTAEPITVALSRAKPRPTTNVLTRPVTLSTFGGPFVSTVKTRPRPAIARLSEPTVVSREKQEDVLKVSLARARPRQTIKVLSGPTVLREFFGPQVSTVRARPRPTITRLGEPTVVRIPSVEQQQRMVRVALVQTRPRSTSQRLSPPRVVRVPSIEQAQRTIRVALIRTRPRPIVTRLQAPTVVSRPAVGRIVTTLVGLRTRRDMSHQFSLQSARQRIVRETGSTVTYQQRDPFIGPRPPQIIDPLPTQRVQTIGVFEPRIKPRPTRTKLGAPTRIIPLPTLRMQTVQVALVRTRPRETAQILAEPTVVAAGFTAPPITVELTHTRPRPTTKVLYEPTVLRVPSVEQQEQTIKVSLARLRPRPTVRILGGPVVLRVFDGPSITTVVTRPRPTSYIVREPVVLRQAVFYGPLVVLTRIRPRPTAKELTPPTALVRATFSGPEVFTVKTRPRPTAKTLSEPTVVRVPSVEQLQQTILVKLVRTRPRHVIRTLSLPTVLRTFVGPRVTLVKSRPRPTTRRLAPPTRVLIQSVFQAQQTIRVKFVQTRPRPTTRRLTPPAKLAVQAVFQKQQTIRTALVQTRPRPTTTILTPPTKLAVASVFQVQQTIQVSLATIVPPPTVPVLRAPTIIATTTRGVAIITPTHPNDATTSETELTEAVLSSGRADTIAQISESEATEATVSESELTEAETEAT